eukprot:3941755-Rhodomonas_salina.3
MSCGVLCECLVLTSCGTALRIRYDLSSTELRYCAMRCPVLSAGTLLPVAAPDMGRLPHSGTTPLVLGNLYCKLRPDLGQPIYGQLAL